MPRIHQIACTCGQLQLELESTPIIAAECHCNSCRAAGVKLSALPSGKPFQETNGGTRFVLYRKDRVRFVAGAERLKEFRLSPEAPTRRVVAGCCNTPVYLELENGHWLSLYGCLWPEGALPAPQLRTMTSDLSDPSLLDDSIPHGKLPTLSFFAKLLGAWIAMGFRSPKISVEGGTI